MTTRLGSNAPGASGAGSHARGNKAAFRRHPAEKLPLVAKEAPQGRQSGRNRRNRPQTPPFGTQSTQMR
jgi:hypothetical protein